MKKNNKGFTLIELLVVVAIIGILAAVGTVAYNGYTAGAKKASAKSNHATVVKYIAAEDQKCNIGETSAMRVTKPDGTLTELTCSGRDGTSVIAAAALALADFKNPYDPKIAAVRSSSAYAAKEDMGFVNMEATGNVLTITTCFQNDCATAGGEAPTVVNTVEVAE
ncbi:type II secretion system GspH family protein [Pelagibacteraceae bacterium]|nr:type II secretion system GspH family protein [Pelagibacteraceae bacterium]